MEDLLVAEMDLAACPAILHQAIFQSRPRMFGVTSCLVDLPARLPLVPFFAATCRSAVCRDGKSHIPVFDLALTRQDFRLFKGMRHHFHLSLAD